MDQALVILSLLGTAVFAASGALVAAEQRFDQIGALFLSVAAGIGGGTIADVLIDGRVRWLDAPAGLWVALGSAVLMFQVVRFAAPPEKTLAWADAAGLALFSATGVERLSVHGLDPVVTIFLTGLGAAGGGIIRDVLANRVPLVFSGEIYVTAVILGALSYYLVSFFGLGDPWPLVTVLAVTFIVRAAGILFAIRLPAGVIRSHRRQ
jgi:uncharacterized membrane protein YeiH